MNNQVLNILTSVFIMTYSCEIMLYLFICNVFKLKINKKKAYILAVLCALYLPLSDTILGFYVGTKIVPLTVALIVFIKINSFICELILIAFLLHAVDVKWYRCYWITIILHVLLMLPYAMMYSNYFLIKDINNNTVYLPVNSDNIILYLFFLAVNIVWGLIIIRLGSIKKQVKWLEQISKFSWGILYLLWAFLMLNTDKFLDSSEYKAILHKGNTNELFSWFSTVDMIAVYGLLIVILMIASVNIAQRKHLKIENNLLKEMLENQYANYLSMQQQEMEIHKLYHDIGNHIETIQVLVSNGENMEASEYTGNLVHQYRGIRKHYYCSNRIINAVLLQKFKLCEQHGIEYETDIKLPEELPFRDIDLMSVFSNLMDNAIEGCLRNNEAKNYIVVKTAVIGRYFNVKITNTKSPVKLKKNGTNSFATLKADKKMHGFGLKILDEIINRYDGHKELKDHGNEFSAMVMLRLPMEQGKDTQSKLLA